MQRRFAPLLVHSTKSLVIWRRGFNYSPVVRSPRGQHHRKKNLRIFKKGDRQFISLNTKKTNSYWPLLKKKKCRCSRCCAPLSTAGNDNGQRRGYAWFHTAVNRLTTKDYLEQKGPLAAGPKTRKIVRKSSKKGEHQYIYLNTKITSKG